MNRNDNGATAVQAAPPRNDPDDKEVPRRKILINVVALGGLALSLIAGIMVDAPTLWGLLPIALYAVLALLGMDIMVATVVAIISAFLILLPPPDAVGDVLGESVGDQITIIGLIIMLGAGLAEVLRATGVAGTIVRAIMRTVGEKNRTAVTLGVMLSCLILVAALGTLAGALAIAVPLLLPIAARMGFTRSATASMIFIGGCAGLALAPFAGSNVAIMDAAEVSYLQYLLYGAGPLAVLSLVMGLLVVPWMQRRTMHDDDFYDATELGALDHQSTQSSKRATAIFLVALVASIVYATITSAGTTFPLLALPTLAIVTGLAGGLTPPKIAAQIYDGAASLISVFLLFWLLAVLFAAINLIEPFTVILDSYGGKLGGLSPFVFALAIALLGWVGIPGATAAQVVLLDQVFGGLAATVGVGAGSWVVVLLFASKADTYGPFPNANMIGAMGLARSLNLRNMLITGWLLLIPSTVMYAAIIFFETR
ncbi:permease [Rhodococcus opacus]|uniref:Permease n=1 Tax=Rhodococcus opacus TaxID=37919 RepID=A0A1B1KEU3_RHOOP|nr:Na+/H+ antiporter NhaC family protein [Rhodococcus opacus]ANS31145.1 permease [Rhodococcus opacus]